ncbi:MAG: division/cell wall cluster transcriptional repressor MraZ [Porticoccaceae bacterium]|mgnify:FL=1|nr:MAG: division/cell wall cluster transcriptional repressor MraZ [SAR92 bacterium BACL16 MAG-120619-bin48]KRP27051.1 MAG: division/cell wall cluster transcriptional repressor MraZ [SAR92 bacterium BACL16 MAG-120322-bin99]MDO7635130.1 division/cell wall cluster transcriptional repressor MraZ [Porticoccaceae bacterium]MDP4654912.1 division/cell wall cluster transcriptional repressor MraZ [Alphaproteobacteria bacterium]MDP4745556.1 division/cell wall cluster transcriptional repressor MraZ [Portic
MFKGSDPINMDAKGRMAIPTRYRTVLDEICSGDLVITIDMKSTCLTLSPLPEWKKFEEKVAALPALDDLAEMLSRFVVGQAKDLQVDGSGRILIPPELRDYAQLEKKLVLVGRTRRLEIWSEDNWNAERQKSQENYRGMLLDRENMSDALKNLSW